MLYHLRHALYTLERVAELAAETLIVETHLDAQDVARPAMIFYPGQELNGDPTNWFGPNPRCVEAIVRDVGFERVEYTPNGDTRGIFHAYRV